MFKVGDYVTIKNEFTWITWYHDRPMIILEVSERPMSVMYRVDYKFDEYPGMIPGSDSYTINGIYIELSKLHNRDKIIDEILN